QKTQRLDGVNVGEGRRGNRKEGLNGVTEGICGGCADKFVRQGYKGVRVRQTDIRSNTAAHDADLAAVFGIADYGKLGDIGTGTAGRGAEDQRRERTNDPVRPFKVADISSVGHQNSD